MIFLQIGINIWLTMQMAAGSTGGVPAKAILDAQNAPILDAAGAYILSA